jgi:hypothetical protein
MTQYNIEIKTESDLKAAQQYEKQLQTIIGQTKQLGQDTSTMEKELGRVTQALGSANAVEVQRVAVLEKAIKNTKALGGDTNALTKALHDAEKALGPQSFADKLIEKTHRIKEAFEQGASGGKGMIGGLLGAAGEIGGGAIAGAASLVEGYHLAKEAVEEYARAESDSLKLQGSLALRGQLTQEYLEKLQKLAEEQEKLTTVEHNRWESIIGQLTRFGASEKNIDEVVDGVKNLAGAMGLDVETAATIMTKAMSGNFEMLGRYNIKVREGASASENFAFVLQQVKERGSGILEAQASGIEGNAKRIGQAWENMKRSAGAFIAEPLRPLLDQLAHAMEFYAEKAHYGTEASDKFVNSLRGNTEILEDAAMSQMQLAKAIEKMGIAADTATKKYERLKGAIQDVLQMQNDEASAKMDVELALVDDQQERGKLTKTQAALKKSTIRQRYSREKFQREQQADQDTFDANTTLARSLEKQYNDLQRQKKEIIAPLGSEKEMVSAQSNFSSLERSRNYVKKVIASLNEEQSGGIFQEGTISTARKTEIGQQLKVFTQQLHDIEEAMKDVKIPKTTDLRRLDQINAQIAAFDKNERPRLEQTYTEQLATQARMNSRSNVYGYNTEGTAVKTGTEIFGLKRDQRDKEVEEAQKALKEGRKVATSQQGTIQFSAQELMRIQQDNNKMAIETIMAALQTSKGNRAELNQIWTAIKEIQSVTKKNSRNP